MIVTEVEKADAVKLGAENTSLKNRPLSSIFNLDKPYPDRLEGYTMLTLEQLIEFYGYPVLTPSEVQKVHSGSFNWQSLEGEIVLRKCLKSFPAYLQAANYGYKMTAYHYSLAANQQYLFERGPNPGMPYGIVLLAASPQTGKSLSISESFPSWVIIKNPRIRIICLGYSGDFANRFGRRNRDKVGNMAPHLTRGRVKLHDKVQSADNWEVMLLDEMSKLFYSSNGGMVSTGMTGQTTGNTGNYVQIDDPLKGMADALSETMVANTIELFQSSIETRLIANPGSMLCVMNTRWVTNDMHGWLRKHRKKYIVGDLNYAALCTEGNQFNDPLRRVVGEGLCPEMGLDGHWAETIKDGYENGQGIHVFRAMYQGEPSNEKGNLFKDEDWQEYEIEKKWVPSKMDRIYLSVDCTFKDLTENDFVAMELTGIMQGNTYLRYLVRKQMDLPDTIDKIIELCRRFPEIDVIYIEDKANGPGVEQVLRKWRRKLGIDDKDFPSVVTIDPQGGKYSRAQTASVYQRDGRCYLPCEADAHKVSNEADFQWEETGLSYILCYKQELGTFPFAGNDDLVDAFSQGIKKNIPLLSGDEKPQKRTERFTRYTHWSEFMEKDFRSLRTREDKNAFIRMHGANIKWKPEQNHNVIGGMI